MVGEIGIERREYLYELKFWELQAAITGYHRRKRPYWEMSRAIAWASMFCMGGKDIPPMSKWWPFSWEQEASVEDVPSEEEIAEMRELIKQENEKNKRSQGKP